tara:strand:+ start:959 stop:1462 length:504 start_codon:yes stop_codon:yes gene_type:complete
MKIVKGNLFSVDSDAVAITTNGFIKKDRSAVMGRGCALQASKQIAGLAQHLGNMIALNGNTVQVIHDSPILISFPVKPSHAIYDGNNAVQHMRNKFHIGQRIPGWACKASQELIATSAHQLRILTDAKGWQKVAIPRPGCGAGELNWLDIKSILSEILDDRFHSISF